MSMQRFSMIIGYVGTGYCGWQRQVGFQATRPSIQETLEEILLKITQEKVSVVGSGRTDAGVHAVGQVAHFSLMKKKWSEDILFKAINSLLPHEIQVKKLQAVPESFHAQRSAEKKRYSYYIQQGPAGLPQWAPYSWWQRRSLNVEAMRRGLEYLQGERDFVAFRASGAAPGSTVKNLSQVEIEVLPVGFPVRESEEFFLIAVRLMGSGFLKQMVRGIMGTLVQVGDGRRDPECFAEILEAKDRSLVGPTAPARGLWLDRVWYPSFPELF